MTIDSRLTTSIRDVVFEISNDCFLTREGFQKLSWVCRTFRWLFSWTGIVESATQVCAQKTFDQIQEACAPFIVEKDPHTLAKRSILMRSLVNGELNLDLIRGSAAKACASFEQFLIQSFGFDPQDLTPPLPPISVRASAPPSPSPPPSISAEGEPSWGGADLGTIDLTRPCRNAKSRSSADLEVAALVDARDGVAGKAPSRVRSGAGHAGPALSPPLIASDLTTARERAEHLVAQAGVPGQEEPPEALIFKHRYPMSDDRGDPRDGDTIREIINIIHGTSVIKLKREEDNLRRLGQKLTWHPKTRRGVHPLRFISFILNDPELLRKLREFKNGGVSKLAKWNPFVNDLAKSLSALQNPKKPKKGEAEGESEDLLEMHTYFAASLKVEPSVIKPYFTSRDPNRWIQMITTLVG